MLRTAWVPSPKKRSVCLGSSGGGATPMDVDQVKVRYMRNNGQVYGLQEAQNF